MQSCHPWAGGPQVGAALQVRDLGEARGGRPRARWGLPSSHSSHKSPLRGRPGVCHGAGDPPEAAFLVVQKMCRQVPWILSAPRFPSAGAPRGAGCRRCPVLGGGSRGERPGAGCPPSQVPLPSLRFTGPGDEWSPCRARGGPGAPVSWGWMSSWYEGGSRLWRTEVSGGGTGKQKLKSLWRPGECGESCL